MKRLIALLIFSSVLCCAFGQDVNRGVDPRAAYLDGSRTITATDAYRLQLGLRYHHLWQADSAGNASVGASLELVPGTGNGNFYLRSALNQSSIIWLKDTVNRWVIQRTGVHNLTFYSYGIGATVISLEYATGNISVGTGTADPTTRFSVFDNSTTDYLMGFTRFADSDQGADTRFSRSRGTTTASSPLLLGDLIAESCFSGNDNATMSELMCVEVKARENLSSTNHGVGIDYNLTKVGTSTKKLAFSLDVDLASFSGDLYQQNGNQVGNLASITDLAAQAAATYLTQTQATATYLPLGGSSTQDVEIQTASISTLLYNTPPVCSYYWGPVIPNTTANVITYASGGSFIGSATFFTKSENVETDPAVPTIITITCVKAGRYKVLWGTNFVHGDGYTVGLEYIDFRAALGGTAALKHIAPYFSIGGDDATNTPTAMGGAFLIQTSAANQTLCFKYFTDSTVQTAALHQAYGSVVVEYCGAGQ